jgi:hypothetical protein
MVHMIAENSVVAWILFVVPLAAAVFAWVGLYRHWSAEQHRFTRVSAIVLATAAPLLACGALAYVEFVRPLPAFDYRVEAWGLLLSFVGTILLGIGHPSLSSLVFFIGAWRLGVDACAVLFGWFHLLKAPTGVRPLIVFEKVRRERRWTSAGENPARHWFA